MILYLLMFLLILLVIIDQIKPNRLRTLYDLTKPDHLYLPFVGHGYLFIGNREDLMDRLQKLTHQAYRNKHGMLGLWMFNQFCVAIVNPKDAKLVFKFCIEKGDATRFSRHLVGNGTIFAPVNIWRRRRKILSRSTAPKIIDSFFEVFVRNSSAVAEELASVAGKGNFSFWKYFCSYTLNSACETIYGEDLNLQKKIDHPFVQALVEYFENLGARNLQVWLHFDVIYKLLPVYKTQQNAKKIIHDFAKNLIERNKLLKPIKRSYMGQYDHTKRKTFLDMLIQFSGGEVGYTEEELLEETLVLLLASSDTSATAGSFTLLLLSQHSGEQDKVYKEIQEVFGDSDITYDKVSKLKYLDAVVKESLRLYPPGPLIVRKCDRDLELPSGLVLNKDCEIAINIWGIHRNPSCWGADADQFRPERFLSATPEQLSAFMPFVTGGRNCLGYRYAMLSLKVMLVTILQRYSFKPASSFTYNNIFRLEFGFMMKHVENFEVQIEQRTRINM